MAYTVYVNILPHDNLLDPAGKATEKGMLQLGFAGVSQVRVGRRIRLSVEAASTDAAKEIATEAAKKLLANAIMEKFEVEVG